MQTSKSINDMNKYANSANNGAREMEFGSVDAADDGELTSVGLEEIPNDFVWWISKAFATQDDFVRE